MADSCLTVGLQNFMRLRGPTETTATKIQLHHLAYNEKGMPDHAGPQSFVQSLGDGKRWGGNEEER